MVKAHLFRDDIRRPETDAPDIIRKTVGILLYDPDAVISVGLVDPGGMAGRDVVALQEEHDVLDLLLLQPALFDPLHTHLADAGHLQQQIRILLDHVQRLRPELPYDAAGELRAHALDQTAAEILLNAVDRRRQRLLKSLHGKLAAVLAVDPPGTPEIQHASHMHIRHGAHYRHQILIALRPALDDRVAVFRILVSDAFHNAPQMFHLLCHLLPCYGAWHLCGILTVPDTLPHSF